MVSCKTEDHDHDRTPSDTTPLDGLGSDPSEEPYVPGKWINATTSLVKDLPEDKAKGPDPGVDDHSFKFHYPVESYV